MRSPIRSVDRKCKGWGATIAFWRRPWPTTVVSRYPPSRKAPKAALRMYFPFSCHRLRANATTEFQSQQPSSENPPCQEIARRLSRRLVFSAPTNRNQMPSALSRSSHRNSALTSSPMQAIANNYENALRHLESGRGVAAQLRRAVDRALVIQGLRIAG